MKACFYDLCMDDMRHPVLQEVRSLDANCIKGAADAVDVIESSVQLSRCAEEYAYILGMNSAGRILGIFEVGHGTCCSVTIDRRGIAIRLLLCGASHVVFVHNHPGGSLKFSDPDLECIESLRELCRLLCMKLMDSIIISPDGYVGYLDTTHEEP